MAKSEPENSDYIGASRVASAAEMRAVDARAAGEFGVPGAVLMENAGRAVCAEIGAHTGPVVVLCGPGNNGGDGLVIARTLHNRGVPVRAVFVGKLEPLDRFSAEAQLQHALWSKVGEELVRIEVPGQVGRLETLLAGADLVVDALFGTGLERPLEGPFAAAVKTVADTDVEVVAVDLPSGLHADSGAVLGVALPASATVTFGAWKRGLLLDRGPQLAGRVTVAEIGLPVELIAALPGRI